LTHRLSIPLAAGLADRLRTPRILAAVVLIGLTGGIVLAFLVRRDELAGADALVYWTAVRNWLAGTDIYLPPPATMPYSYSSWTVFVFLPWALLPWEIAWFCWRAAEVALFALSVGWAYTRRPLATALLLAVLGASLAANLDTGNVAVLLVLGIWLAWWVGPRLGGGLWALAAALKWLPLALIFFIPARARAWGLLVLAVAAALTLATWPATLRQLEIVWGFPRPIRVDYMLLAWAIVPWLWSQPWPPYWLSPTELRRRWHDRPPAAHALRAWLGLTERSG
jgi:hypothetical protein